MRSWELLSRDAVKFALGTSCCDYLRGMLLPNLALTNKNEYKQQQLTDRNDLKNVCEVSKYLYSAAASILYQFISVTADNDLLNYVAVKELLCASCHKTINLLHFIKDIQISFKFHYKIMKWCFHYNFDYNNVEYDEDDEFADNNQLNVNRFHDDKLDDDELHDKKKWIENEMKKKKKNFW